jgi:hypothetical protein
VPYFPVGPPMHGPWGPPLMMYLLCPPWVGWYRPWALPLMHFHLRWSILAEDFGHRGYYVGDDGYRYVGHQQDSRTPRQENRMVHLPRKQQQPQSSRASERRRRTDPLPINQGAIRVRQGRGTYHRSMVKRSPMWKGSQRRW